jgi:hypothetical protein
MADKTRQQRIVNVLRAGGKLLAKRSANKLGYFDIFLEEEEGSTREAIHPITLRSLLKSKEIGEVQRQKAEEQVEFRIVEPLERIEWIIERAKRDSARLPAYCLHHAETAIRETLEEVAPLLNRDTQRAVQKVLNFYYQSIEDERSFREGDEHE